jgi:hypothetical protein
MTTTSIVCGTCAAPVSYGRLSCPSCGALLASVSGARRTPASVASSTTATSLPDVLYDVDSAPTGDVVEGQLALDDPEAEPPSAAAADGAPLELDQPSNGLVEHDNDLDGLFRDEDDQPAPEAPSTTAGHAWAVKGASMTGPATPAYMPRPNYARAAAEASAAEAAALGASAAVPSAVDPPGAYVPPLPASSLPAGPAGPAREWAGHGIGVDSDPAASSASRAGEARNHAVDATRFAEFVGSVSIAGAALAAVGFLLPWASSVIGSSGTGYFDRWGLAGPGHGVVVIGILAVLATSIVRNPIPSWIRTGLGGLAVGALLLGLTWPYLLGPLDAAPGVLIDAIGAIALIVSGTLALVTDRQSEAGQPV